MIQKLLDRLEKVRRVGDGRWLARCPAHRDGRPSLSVRDAGDRLLIHCFAGCGAVDVVESVGLSLGDLFPEKIPLGGFEHRPPQMPASDALRLLDEEAWFVELSARRAAKDKLTAEDRHELARAATRISEVRLSWMKARA